MNYLIKILSICVYSILPRKYQDKFSKKVGMTKAAFTCVLELRILVKIITWILRIIFLPITLLFALLKTILIWILGDFVNVLRFIFNEFYLDISKRHMGISLSVKRTTLRIALFTKGKEVRKTFGDLNPEITFYVIRPYYYLETNELCPTIANLLYHYYRVLHSIAYALNKGYVPVVDWKNYGRLPHMEEGQVNGTSNGWEYYWNQPGGYSLEEAYQSKNVILSTRNSQSYQFMPTIAIYSPFTRYVNSLAKCCPQYDRFITFNEITQNYIDSWGKKLFKENERILGVSVRGVAYGVKKIPGHPVQPNINELVTFLNEKLEEWSIDKIYFTCEASWMVDEMINIYGDKLIVLPRKRYDKAPTAEDNPLYEPGVRYQTNLDYLTEMYLLSKCTSLVAGMSSGVRNAVIWNNQKYEHIHIFESDMWK